MLINKKIILFTAVFFFLMLNGVYAVSCGSTITTNTILTGNLGPCSGNGISIGSNSITLDCNGYTISGDGNFVGDGVDNMGFNNVVIKNCTITKFFYGIYFSGGSGKIANNAVNSNNDTGILIESSSNNIILNNTVNSNVQYGVWLYSSSKNNITRNIVNSNGNVGIVLQEDSNNNLVYDNFFNNTINAADDGYNSWNILDPSLVGSWHFDNIYGDTTWDFSGNNNHGTLYNFASNTICSSASEGSTISVSCPSGSAISSIINSVYVDNRSSASCSNPDPGSYGYRYCNYADNCVGQNSCSFMVSNTNCGGDPAFGHVKKLILQVACNNSIGVEGKFRKAIKFDGVDDYVDVGSNPSLKMTGQVTVEAWVKIASFPFPTNYHNVLSDHSLSSNNGKILRFSNNDIQFLLGDAGTTPIVKYTFDSSAAGNWQHLAATYDGSMMKLYVNGTLVDSKSNPGSIAANSNPILIGKSGWGEYFNGIIDEVRIYNKSLTQDEISSDFQHGAIKKLGTSIIGGNYTGGNYWSNYDGTDTDGDWIGDTDLPYASRGSPEHIQQGGDPLTLKLPDCNRVSGIITFTACDKTKQPLQYVKVTLENDSGATFTAYTDAHGVYGINFCGKQASLTVSLEASDGSKIYQRVSASESGSIVTAFYNFHINEMKDLRQDVDLSSSSDKFSGTSCDPSKLGQYALIYDNINKCLVDFARDTLKLNFKCNPVKVVGYTSINDHNTSFDPASNTIYIRDKDSLCGGADKPMNAEWHECGHYIMYDSSNCHIPSIDGKYHDGYKNPSSSASWVEGFAEFMSMLIAHYQNLPEFLDGRYYWLGGINEINTRPWDNLELNFNPQTTEEFSTASILWDLFDGIDEKDNDFAQLSLPDLWSVLSQPSINNTFELYKALNVSGKDRLNFYDGKPPTGIRNLDKIFIAHGVFYDTNGNGKWDPGEPIGYTKTKDSSGKDVPRYDKPLLDGSYLNLTVIDSSTGLSVSNVTLYIIEKNDNPVYEMYDHQESINVSGLPGLVYYGMEPMPTTTEITVRKQGYLESEPIKMNSSFYWSNLGKGYILSHTFYLRLATPITTCPYAINSPGSYVLMNNLSTTGTCINMNANNVILDCNGYDMHGSGSGYGVIMSAKSNITVKNCVIDGFNMGVVVSSSTNPNTITRNTITSNVDRGVYIVNSNYNNVIENTVTLNPGYGGIVLWSGSYNNLISDNKIENNSIGVLLVSNSNNNVTRNIVENNHDGISLSDASNSRFDSDTTQDNLNWDYVEVSSADNTVINLTTKKNVLSFQSRDIALKGLDAGNSPNDPNGYTNISKYINATNTSAIGWLYLNVSYSDEAFTNDVFGIYESSLRIWEYNGAWLNAAFYNVNGVDTANNVVYANITSFGSILAPLGIAGNPPVCQNNIWEYGEWCGHDCFIATGSTDMNHDCIVDTIDWELIGGMVGSRNPSGDLNGDGVVNVLDLFRFAGHYGDFINNCIDARQYLIDKRGNLSISFSNDTSSIINSTNAVVNSTLNAYVIASDVQNLTSLEFGLASSPNLIFSSFSVSPNFLLVVANESRIDIVSNGGQLVSGPTVIGWATYNVKGNGSISIIKNSQFGRLEWSKPPEVLYRADFASTSNGSVTASAPSTIITILSPVSGPYYHKVTLPLNFIITNSTPITWISYSLDDKPNITIPGPINLSNMTSPYKISDGSHIITIYANDTSNNMGSSSANFYFCSGDVNNDKKIDGKDIALISIAYGSAPGYLNWNATMDINDDNKVDGKDVTLASIRYGKACP